MRLIYISHWRFPAEKTHAAFAMKTCEMFAKHGFDVELWAPYRNNSLSREDPFLYHGIKPNFIIRRFPTLDLTGILPGSFFFFMMAATFQLFFSAFYLLKSDFNKAVLYFHDARDAILPRWFGGPMFLEIHDFYRSSAGWINRLVFSRIAGFIVTNRVKIERLQKEFGIPREKMLYQPNAVDLKMFGVNISKEEARLKLNLSQDKRIILYAGHLFPWKGADTLFEAHKFFTEDEVIYLVGGTEEDIEKLKVEGLKLKVANVVIVGRRPHSEIPLWLQAADVLILPNSAKFEESKYETSPVKLFEYMVSARPMVVSDLPSIRDILDESTAFFFKPDNPRSLAETIHYILRHSVEGEARSGKAREMAKNYSWEKRTEAIVEFLNSRLKNV